MASSLKPSEGPKETVLLRNPKPKYSFDGRKLPKAPVDNVATANASNHLAVGSHDQQLFINRSTTPGRTSQPKPVAVVGASFKPKSLLTADLQKDSQSSPITTTPKIPRVASSIAPQSNEVAMDLSALTQSKNNESLPPTKQNLSTPQPGMSQLEGTNQNNFSAEDSTAVVVVEESNCDSEAPSLLQAVEELRAVREERDKLKAELNSQIQVNTELKRLLVASVGDDLYQRVENLCRDRAQLESDIGGFSKKMSEDYENLDKVSIQADMWRSKYLASRVMTEELSNAKAYIALQCHDSHSALQQLLNERYELRTNLVEGYKVLQQVKNAFDPLNTHKSSSLRSTNVLDLSQSCQQLSEAVRFRLLPTNVVIDVSADVSTEAWQSSITRAEQFAQEVLSRPVELSGSQQPGTSRSLGDQRSESSPNLYTRYHPATRFENLTIDCCTNCKGELKVI